MDQSRFLGSAPAFDLAFAANCLGAGWMGLGEDETDRGPIAGESRGGAVTMSLESPPEVAGVADVVPAVGSEQDIDVEHHLGDGITQPAGGNEAGV